MCRLLTIWLFVLVPAFAIGTANPILAAESRWTELTPMPIAAGGLDSTTVNGLTYAIGGFSSGFATTLHTTQVYDPKTNFWAREPRLHRGLRQHGRKAEGSTRAA